MPIAKGFRVLFFLCIGIAAGGNAQSASNSLQRLDYAVLPAGRVVVKLVFSQELKERPPVLAGYHPAANIVLDLADTASDLRKDPLEIGQSEVRSIQVLSIGTRTRVVITLNRPVSYEIAFTGRELLVTLERRRTGN